MMFEARKSSTRGHLTAALALTPLLLALALLAGPRPAAAQQWPDVNIYYSPDPGGVDPRSETCPPGCVCEGGGPGGTVTINFDELDPSTVVANQYPPATFSCMHGDDVCWTYNVFETPLYGSLGTSDPLVISPSQDWSASVVVDFSSPVQNVSFEAVPVDCDLDDVQVTIYHGGPQSPAFEYVSVGYGVNTTVDLSAYSDVTRIELRPYECPMFYDDFSFDTGGGEQDCVINAGTNEEVSLWIDGGSDPAPGTGDICMLPPDGNTGDYLCGADILIQITQGMGKFTHFRPRIDTLVHHPDCVIPAPDDDEICPLPADTKQIRMNFRRGEAAILGPQRVADLFVDSTGSEVGSPTTVVVSGVEAASANLQVRPIAAGGSEVIAEGPVGPDEPCVLQCDFTGGAEPGVPDGTVGLPDFNVLVSHYGQTVPACTLGDCDCNGAVGSTDFTQLSVEWGQSCPQ